MIEKNPILAGLHPDIENALDDAELLKSVHKFGEPRDVVAFKVRLIENGIMRPREIIADVISIGMRLNRYISGLDFMARVRPDIQGFLNDDPDPHIDLSIRYADQRMRLDKAHAVWVDRFDASSSKYDHVSISSLAWLELGNACFYHLSHLPIAVSLFAAAAEKLPSTLRTEKNEMDEQRDILGMLDRDGSLARRLKAKRTQIRTGDEIG